MTIRYPITAPGSPVKLTSRTGTNRLNPNVIRYSLVTARWRRSTVITWYRNSMPAVTPPAASITKHSPRYCSKSMPYRKLMMARPNQLMAPAITTVMATMITNITTMIRSNFLRFAGSAQALAIFSSMGL